MIHIGIDTGTKTGFAVWDSDKRKLLEVATLTITRAMDKVKLYSNLYRLSDPDGIPAGADVKLHIEDARLRTWFGNAGREKLQGAGSVKRDARIWEDWCKENEISYRMVAPRNNKTKLNPARFRTVTGWMKTTSEHSRDAVMMIYGL